MPPKDPPKPFTAPTVQPKPTPPVVPPASNPVVTAPVPVKKPDPPVPPKPPLPPQPPPPKPPEAASASTIPPVPPPPNLDPPKRPPTVSVPPEPKPRAVIARYQGLDPALEERLYAAVGKPANDEEFGYPNGAASKVRVLRWYPKSVDEQNAISAALGTFPGVETAVE